MTTDSAYLTEAARRATFDTQMRVSTSARSFQLRIGKDRIASISTLLENQELAAKTIAARYNAVDGAKDILQRASTLLETAIGVMGEPSEEVPESADWFTQVESLRAEIAKLVGQ